MSEKCFNVSGKVSITAGKIISIEKGNVEKPVTMPVCAFSMEVEGSQLPVKVILKGETAVRIWNRELKDGATLSSPTNQTVVNVDAEVREVRQKEFVIHNPTNIEFFKANIYKVS